MTQNARANLQFSQGKTWQKSFALKDSTGAIVQFPAGTVVAFQMRRLADDADPPLLFGDSTGAGLPDVQVTVDPLLGEWELVVSATATEAFGPDCYHYEFEQTYTDGTVPPLLEGRILVQQYEVVR